MDSLPDSTMIRIGADVYRAPMTFAPVDTGLFFATVFVPNAYPYTAGVHVTNGKRAKLKSVVIPLDTLQYEIQTEVTKEQVNAFS